MRASTNQAQATLQKDRRGYIVSTSYHYPHLHCVAAALVKLIPPQASSCLDNVINDSLSSEMGDKPFSTPHTLRNPHPSHRTVLNLHRVQAPIKCHHWVKKHGALKERKLKKKFPFHESPECCGAEPPLLSSPQGRLSSPVTPEGGQAPPHLCWAVGRGRRVSGDEMLARSLRSGFPFDHRLLTSMSPNTRSLGPRACWRACILSLRPLFSPNMKKRVNCV